MNQQISPTHPQHQRLAARLVRLAASPGREDALEIPADLEVEQSGVCFIDGQDELDYLWYRLREAEGGREYAGYRVVRLLQLTFLPLEARSDPGLLQKMRTVLRGLYGSKVSFLYLAAGIFQQPAIAGWDCPVLWRFRLCTHVGRSLRPIEAQPGSAQRGHERGLSPDPPGTADCPPG